MGTNACMSTFFAGIHTQLDVTTGLNLGAAVAQQVGTFSSNTAIYNGFTPSDVSVSAHVSLNASNPGNFAGVFARLNNGNTLSYVGVLANVGSVASPSYDAILGLAAFFALRQPEKGEGAGDRARPLPPIAAGTLDTISVTRQGVTSTIKREGGKYKVTAPVAAAMIVLSGIVGGSKGLVGALLGVGLVIVFFGISAFAMVRASRHSPQVMVVTAITTYLVKILVLLFLVAKYSGTTAFNGKLFGFTVIVCVIVYTTAQAVIAARLKIPYVEPHGEQIKVPHVEPDGKR